MTGVSGGSVHDLAVRRKFLGGIAVRGLGTGSQVLLLALIGNLSGQEDLGAFQVQLSAVVAVAALAVAPVQWRVYEHGPADRAHGRSLQLLLGGLTVGAVVVTWAATQYWDLHPLIPVGVALMAQLRFLAERLRWLRRPESSLVVEFGAPFVLASAATVAGIEPLTSLVVGLGGTLIVAVGLERRALIAWSEGAAAGTGRTASPSSSVMTSLIGLGQLLLPQLPFLLGAASLSSSDAAALAVALRLAGFSTVLKSALAAHLLPRLADVAQPHRPTPDARSVLRQARGLLLMAVVPVFVLEGVLLEPLARLFGLDELPVEVMLVLWGAQLLNAGAGLSMEYLLLRGWSHRELVAQATGVAVLSLSMTLATDLQAVALAFACALAARSFLSAAACYIRESRP